MSASDDDVLIVRGPHRQARLSELASLAAAPLQRRSLLPDGALQDECESPRYCSRSAGYFQGPVLVSKLVLKKYSQRQTHLLNMQVHLFQLSQ